MAKRQHGKSTTKLYYAWSGMKRRCYNENYRRYCDYGGRGIKMCNEWQHFEAFYEWSMANGFKEGLSIDRIDNNGDYEPSNCRWATTREQSLNKRVTRFVTINGREITLTELSEMTGIGMQCLNRRYSEGIRNELILSPVHRGNAVRNRTSELDADNVRKVAERIAAIDPKELNI